MSLRTPLFPRHIAYTQMVVEDTLLRAVDSSNCRLILCHRDSLNPLAYRLKQGWSDTGFYEYTETTRDIHYSRYAAVLHL
jgi:hypothetical protein